MIKSITAAMRAPPRRLSLSLRVQGTTVDQSRFPKQLTDQTSSQYYSCPISSSFRYTTQGPSLGYFKSQFSKIL